VPWLVKNGDIQSLVQVVRSAHWIAPKDDAIVSTSHKWSVLIPQLFLPVLC
jgi:hypothetical protein